MVEKHLISIIESALVGDKPRVEMAATILSKSVKKENPLLSQKINDLLEQYTFMGRQTLRGAHTMPPPVDPDSQLEMVNIYEPDLSLSPKPIFNDQLDSFIHDFLHERNFIKELLKNELKPSNSLIITGPPGTGKTMLAKYIASALNKTLVVLDLSASISSFLGKTGHNLKKVLTYARHTSAVLLLDEFDAIAKKRDDSTDLGEIKRVVNILLMELENWPPSSVLLATSNHPDLLDKAVWRRFDHSITLGMPEPHQIEVILYDQLKDFITDDCKSTIKPIVELLDDISPADICRYTNNVKRRIVIKKEPFIKALIGEISAFSHVKNARGKICEIAKSRYGQDLTVRELANITGLSPSGVQFHINKAKSSRNEQ